MKIHRFIILIFALSFQFNCTTAQSENTYTQTISLSDNKQNLRLTLGSDKYYRLIVQYADTPKMPEAYAGNYIRTKNVVALTGNVPYKYFSLNDNTMQWCDETGRALNNQTVLTNDTGMHTSLDKRDEQKIKNGIDFFALGQEPGWMLDIDFENKITFKNMEGVVINMPTGKVQQAMDANVKSMLVKTERATLAVTWQKGTCKDVMSGETFDYIVTVTLTEKNNQNQIYKGCGKYLANENLNGNWFLEQVGNEFVNHSILQKSNPELIIDINGKSFTGHAGCNRFSGSLFVESKTLRFTEISATEMACADGGFENRCMKALTATTTYKIVDNTLILSNPNGTTLTYKRNKFEMKKSNALNKTWQLIELNGHEIIAGNQIKGLPQLTLNTQTLTYGGHTGCNNINGKFTNKDNTISFLPGAMTRMACPGNLEDDFLKAFHKVNAYALSGNMLTLFVNDETVMVFKAMQ